MKRLLFFIFIFLIWFMTFSGHAAANPPIISNPRPFQGDAVVVTFGEQKTIRRATFDGVEVASFSYKNGARVVFGVPTTKNPGRYPLHVEFTDGSVFDYSISVFAKRFPKIVLGIPKELGLTPTGLTQKLQEEKVNIDAVVNIRAPQVFFSDRFGLPLADNRYITSPFGEIRKTGDTEIRHLGTDFGARLGAAVGAMNGGLVRKAYADTVYGNTVIIDHGQGIFSLYMHLDEMRVKEGEVVAKGKVIGTVGKTGYATSPHLHLSFKIGGVSIDPVNFVSTFR